MKEEKTMNTKKVLSLGLSVLMCGTLLAGCGGNKEEKGADASGNRTDGHRARTCGR